MINVLEKLHCMFVKEYDNKVWEEHSGITFCLPQQPYWSLVSQHIPKSYSTSTLMNHVKNTQNNGENLI